MFSVGFGFVATELLVGDQQPVDTALCSFFVVILALGIYSKLTE